MIERNEALDRAVTSPMKMAELGTVPRASELMLYIPHYDVRSRAFCGPTAMSTVTGERISTIREVIREVWGRTKANGDAMPVMGLDNETLLEAMSRLGWRVVETADCEPDPGQRKDVFRLGDFLDTPWAMVVHSS